ncbi:hypothetical protein [Mariniflexile rhizosphaerae]|uniref:hypothetical protein n=1 Tax=unclassified Mariniflexile TaxID=2643887 RepID=UPI0013C36D83|nr:hypothetical protein [Mariniflexile sp. TRM1-10]
MNKTYKRASEFTLTVDEGNLAVCRRPRMNVVVLLPKKDGQLWLGSGLKNPGNLKCQEVGRNGIMEFLLSRLKPKVWDWECSILHFSARMTQWKFKT